MKLAYLISTYPQISHSFIRREVQALERQDWQITRFAMRSDAGTLADPADIAEDARTEHILQAGAWRILRVAAGWMIRRPLKSLRALRLAYQCGARANARALHMVYLAEAAYLAQRCYDLRLPHMHAHFGTEATTVAMLAQAIGGPSYSFTVHGPDEFDAPLALSLGEKAHRALFAVTISSFGRSQLCRWTPVEHWARISVVHCGIEPWRFSDPLPMPTGGPLLVAIGRLAEQKGLDLLIDAVAQLSDLPALRLTIIGDGPLRTQLEARAKGLPVTFTGWQDEAGVRSALAASHALILPSFAEGLPVVVMEAMAAGRPVIATSIAGLPELVTPDTGWLVPAGDAAALANAIRGMGSRNISSMGHAARLRVFARHDIDKEAEKLITLFASKGRP
jgi:colanic acid/amylovoran biosynthesis glycosyltransferase